MIDFNRTLGKNTLINAFTNNTFDLNETEKSIKKSVTNSFDYLRKLQKSYMNIHRFNLTEKDIYIDKDGRMCVCVEKDFVSVNCRRKYKNSKYYSKFISLKDVADNTDMFPFIPIVILDGKCVFSLKIKCCIDGTTMFWFNDIKENKTFMSKYHDIEIVFIKEASLYKITSKTSNIIANEFKIQKGYPDTKNVKNRSNDSYINAFMFIKGDTEIFGTNIFFSKINPDNGDIILEKTNSLLNYLSKYKNIDIFLITHKDLYSLTDYNNDEFHKMEIRIDNNNNCITVVINNDGVNYNMPIPSNNLFIIKRNKTTGEYRYLNNISISHYYPNIYEIASSDKDPNIDYKIFYFYKDIQGYLKYENYYKYFHRFLNRKYESYDKFLHDVLYTSNIPNSLKNYFINTLNYNPSKMEYNHPDFFMSNSPYDFDYKIDKMKDYISKNPNILRDYGKQVSSPCETYYLKMKTIIDDPDFESRYRDDNIDEIKNEIDYIKFDKTRILFSLRNETSDNLDIRIYINGLLCNDVYQLHVDNVEYIYIPMWDIKESDYIEIEKFYSYEFKKKINFISNSEEIEIHFDKDEFIMPTLYDLFITDENNNKIDRSSVKMYASIDGVDYDISDGTTSEQNGIESFILLEEDLDSDMGEILVSEEITNDTDKSVYLNEDIQDRLSIKYYFIKDLKIKLVNTKYINKPLFLIINKIPYIYNKKMNKDGIPKIKLFNGKVPWRQVTDYVRIFINGRFVPIETLVHEDDPLNTYIIPKCYVNKNDIVSVDISPFSYELEFSQKTLTTYPFGCVLSFNGGLSKPFDIKYYDVYLNGRKLTEEQICPITPDKVAIYNVKSLENFTVYRKDRDYEYYGLTNRVKNYLDDLLENDILSDDEKRSIIEDIIRDECKNKFEILDATNEEDDISVDVLDNNVFERYLFFMNYIIPEGVTKPNSFYIDKEDLKTSYKTVYDSYSNTEDRVVIRPNINYDANRILLIGREDSDLIFNT